MGSDSTPSTTATQQTQQSGPPDYINPYIQRALPQLEQQALQTPQFFPGSTIAGFSPQTEQALNLTQQRATNGSALQNAGNQALTDTASGKYLFGGDGFNAAYQAAANKIIPQVQSSFAGAGRLHSGLAEQAQTSALADAFAGLYGQERNNQMQAAALAPSYAQADYNDINRLADVGAQRDNLAQQRINEDIARFDFNQNAPLQRLQQYLPLLYGAPGQNITINGSQTSPLYQNRTAGALGGGLIGGQVGSQFGPWGAGVGAGLGLLSGLF